jgi:hypothetical protein
VDSPLPDIVAKVLAAHKQPDYVTNVVSSALSLPNAHFGDMFTLLYIQLGSLLEQELTIALKEALGIEFLL